MDDCIIGMVFTVLIAAAVYGFVSFVTDMRLSSKHINIEQTNVAVYKTRAGYVTYSAIRRRNL